MKNLYNRFKTAAYIILLLEITFFSVIFFMIYYKSFNFQDIFNVYIIIICAVSVTLLDAIFMLIGLLVIRSTRFHQEMKVKDLFSTNIEDALNFAQIGMIVTDENQNILWENHMMETIIPKSLDSNILDIFPKLRELYGKSESSSESVTLSIGDKFFSTTYMANAGLYLFKDTTDYENIFKYSKNQAIVLGIIMIDNFNEIADIDEETSDVLSSVRNKINTYFKSYGVLLRKYKSDSYFAICNYTSLIKMQDNNFEILDMVRNSEAEGDITPTLSIGFAHDFPSVQRLNEMASNAMDIAISRGGDQAVVSRYGSDLQFYGGKIEAIENKNKVRVRILADSLSSLIKQASNVLIMTHVEMDLDALGSALGIKALCDYLDIPAKIVYDFKLIERKTRAAFTSMFSKDEANEMTILPKEAISTINSKTVMVCVDFHKPSMALSKEVVDECSKVIIIDHHRRSEEYFENPIFSYIESSASSACELVTELIYYCSANPAINIPTTFATIMLSGIFCDTSFYSSTTSGMRTFEASMVLKKYGADNVTADGFLKDDYEETMLNAC